MRRPSLVHAHRSAAAVLALAAGLAGCNCDSSHISSAGNTNTVEVPISGTQSVPYVMLLVDKSGSMLDPANCPAGTVCKGCGDSFNTYDPTSKTPCKWNDLKKALVSPDPKAPGFLVGAKSLGNYGLAVFPGGVPTGDNCTQGQVLVELDPNSDNVDKVTAELNKVAPHGGTPTSATLQLLAHSKHLSAAEPGRQRLVMILTDGEPNCSTSPENQQRCQSCNSSGKCSGPNACNPTIGSTTSCDTTGALLGAACLDDTGLLSSVTALRNLGVNSVIIWFGSSTSMPLASALLDQAAQAGGLPRTSGGTKYYQAANASELMQLLVTVTKTIQTCTFSLDPAPADPTYLEVALADSSNGNSEQVLVQGKDWQMQDASTVQIIGDACNALQNAPSDTLHVVFRYLTQ